MNKVKLVMSMTVMVFIFMGCATIKDKLPPLDVDRTAQAFFDDLQRSDNAGAYGLFARGLSQRVSFDQFDEFMKTIRDQWGRIESDDTASCLFIKGRRAKFYPLKRYSTTGQTVYF